MRKAQWCLKKESSNKNNLSISSLVSRILFFNFEEVISFLSVEEKVVNPRKISNKKYLPKLVPTDLDEKKDRKVSGTKILVKTNKDRMICKRTDAQKLKIQRMGYLIFFW